ncbi:putative endonuclease lcl3 [Varicellaria rhodocarpa]|nr:putative endonuclease lcl3 [Varicellaria rhodocarpa]
MRWPPWSSNSKEDTSKPRVPLPNPKYFPSPAKEWASPNWDILIPTFILTSTTILSVHVYRSFLRRIPQAASISGSFFRKRSMFGKVTSVGDGDGFRLFHTPGGRLTGWGWMPGRKIPEGRALKDQTISVRIAGVDAPELAHFGRPAQPGSQEALDWLTSYILHRRVRTYVYKRDQYDRAIGTVYVRRGLLRRDVGLQMLKKGLATVYEAKTGAEFGEVEAKYRRAEWWAKQMKKGIWAGKNKAFESPREFKTRTMGI